MDGKYIRFHRIEKKPKTSVYAVYTKNDDQIGTIKWYSPWRQYCFFPDENTVWSKGCLQDINNFIYDLMSQRKLREPEAVE